jgi:hypothetical protein
MDAYDGEWSDFSRNKDMSKGYLATREKHKLPKMQLLNLLKKLGLDAAQFDFFIHLDEKMKTQILVDGQWMELALGDVA